MLQVGRGRGGFRGRKVRVEVDSAEGSIGLRWIQGKVGRGRERIQLFDLVDLIRFSCL